ncbi:glycosyltransferase family 4 protein [Prosthecomicrobium sp. N25]|uniref:glycosyltransferase family 4 protein n=1 Tax=Prosthecomicrobium sp. N25 TaxID=3129254 RepID=UPI00307718A1
MKIAIVLAGIGAGGAERVVSLMAADRVARGDEVHVIGFARAAEASYFSLHPAVRLHALDDGGREGTSIARTLVRILRLRRALKAIGPDLVVSFLTKINIVTLLATRGLGIPVVVSERNNPEAQRSHPLWGRLGRIALPWADGLVMQTDRIRRTLPDRLRAKAVVIANPCEIRPEPVSAAAAPRRIVAVGRLTEQKGFDLLIDAFRRIADRYPDWSLVIFGEGQDRARLQEQVAAAGLAERITLPGLTTSPGAWVREGRVFVLSSRYEGFPNVLVEAMAAGLPVVSTACPYGPSDIVEDGRSGLLVPAEDAVALAAGLDRLLSDAPLRAALAAAAPAAVGRFAKTTVFGQWDALFRRVLSGTPPEASGVMVGSDAGSGG